MLNFRNDYCAIAHPKIFIELEKHLKDTYVGYGLDTASTEAKDVIKKEIGCNDCDIHFLPGGTITNKIFISHVLKPYEAVICCDSGHINVHETGTIEQSGHKVLTVPHENGKLNPLGVEKVVLSHTDEHMVKPKMVYISNSTEYGTIYSKQELMELRKVCDKYGLYLFLDGARLGVALTAKECDLTIKDIAAIADAFYIGGTKNGLMLGEALVIINDSLKNEFRYSIKQLGGMYAKGFVNGIQFKTLFTDGLFYEIGNYQNKLAYKLQDGLVELGIQFEIASQTNQLFPTLPNQVIKKLKESVLFEFWTKGEEYSTIRFVTHFNLDEADIDKLLELIKSSL